MGSRQDTNGWHEVRISRTNCGVGMSSQEATSSKKDIVMLAADDKRRLQTIISNAVGGNSRWLTQQNIWVGDKGSYFVLNYGPGQRNEFDRLVRGMVIRKPDVKVADLLSLIVSFPFVRFHNQHEKEAAPVNFQNAQMIEKLDGTMVGVFFDGSELRWHTRKMICTHPSDLELTAPISIGNDVYIVFFLSITKGSSFKVFISIAFSSLFAIVIIPLSISHK